MKTLKKAFGSKGGSETTNASSQSSPSFKGPWLQASLPAGFYGQFPAEFTVRFSQRSADKKSDCFFLTADNQGSIVPWYALTFHKGRVKCQVTLHSGPNHGSGPLALAGTEGFFKTETIVALPGPAAPPGGGTNQVERMQDHSSFKNELRRFSVAVGPPGDINPSIETFEWRRDNLYRPNQPFERILVRLGGGTTPTGDEVVCKWIGEPNTEWVNKMGSLYFQGRGATGELGQYWFLMAVMSLLWIVKVDWEAAAFADSVINAAGKLAGAGIGMA